MNFKSEYKKFSVIKINCNISEQFTIKRIMFGQGGSNNIIADVNDKNNNKLIIKIIPYFVYANVKTIPNYDELEIKFYQFFTQKYILTDRTPHIVGIYNHQTCSKLDKLINNIKPSNKMCPSYEDQLTKKLKHTVAENKLCDLMLRYEMKLVDPQFDIVLLEHCPLEFRNFIENSMKKISDATGTVINDTINQFILYLDIILFQIIFTLAIIKYDYPGFSHGDLFVRNILLSIESEYQTNDYIVYHYKQKKFYLPANGIYAKINDFGLSLIVDELVPNTYESEKDLNKFYHKNPFNQKTDIFNLLHDIYDGQNLGTLSINKLGSIFEIPRKKIIKIRDFLAKFINVDTIDRINIINADLLNRTWDIDQIKILENSVKTPDEYLKDYFESLYDLPKNAKIIRHFNEPK